MFRMGFLHARWSVFDLGRRRPMKNAAKVNMKTIGRGPHAQRKDGIIEFNVYSMQGKAAWVSGCIKRVLP